MLTSLDVFRRPPLTTSNDEKRSAVVDDWKEPEKVGFCPAVARTVADLEEDKPDMGKAATLHFVRAQNARI